MRHKGSCKLLGPGLTMRNSTSFDSIYVAKSSIVLNYLELNICVALVTMATVARSPRLRSSKIRWYRESGSTNQDSVSHRQTRGCAVLTRNRTSLRLAFMLLCLRRSTFSMCERMVLFVTLSRCLIHFVRTGHGLVRPFLETSASENSTPSRRYLARTITTQHC